MNNNFKKLMDFATDGLEPPIYPADLGSLVMELAQNFGAVKNGFYAYESALLVRSISRAEAPIGIFEWNAEGLWRKNYDQDLSGHIFFSENLFGEQFSIHPNGIFLLDPELGELKFFANDLEEWAKEIISDFDFQTGYSLSHEWQSKYGALKYGERLLPKQPFVLQGSFDINNLVVTSDVEAMKIRAQLARKISNLSDGETIQIEISE